MTSALAGTQALVRSSPVRLSFFFPRPRAWCHLYHLPTYEHDISRHMSTVCDHLFIRNAQERAMKRRESGCKCLKKIGRKPIRWWPEGLSSCEVIMSLSTSPSRFLQLDWRLVQPSNSLTSSLRRALTRKKMDEPRENWLFNFVVFGVDPSKRPHWLAMMMIAVIWFFCLRNQHNILDSLWIEWADLGWRLIRLARIGGERVGAPGSEMCDIETS